MRAWTRRIFTAFWLVLYPIIHVPMLVPLVALLGLGKATLVGIFLIGIWASVFYLLLLGEGGFDKVQQKLVKLRQAKGFGGWLGTHLSRIQEKALVSPIWILVGFALFGSWGGTALIRISYPRSRLLPALLLIWVGCVVNAFFLVVGIYGPPAMLARELVFALFSG